MIRFSPNGMVGRPRRFFVLRHLKPRKSGRPRTRKSSLRYRCRVGAVEPPAPEAPLPRPLSPSRPADDDPPVRSPLGQDGSERFRRGLLIHNLLQTLPDLPGGITAPTPRRRICPAPRKTSSGRTGNKLPARPWRSWKIRLRPRCLAKDREPRCRLSASSVIRPSPVRSTEYSGRQGKGHDCRLQNRSAAAPVAGGCCPRPICGSWRSTVPWLPKSMRTAKSRASCFGPTARSLWKSPGNLRTGTSLDGHSGRT